MPEFHVDVTQCVITVSGELDIEHAKRLTSVAKQATAAPHEGGLLVIDLTDVPFLDSTGLGALLELHKAVTSAGRPVRLRGVQRPVRKVIEISGLTETLGVPAAP